MEAVEEQRIKQEMATPVGGTVLPPVSIDVIQKVLTIHNRLDRTQATLLFVQDLGAQLIYYCYGSQNG